MAHIKKRLFGLILLQAVFFVCISALLWAIFDGVVAYSVLLGSGVFILPTLVFAWFAFRYQGARRAKQVMASFYWGETLKIFVAIALFAAVFKTLPLSVLAFFVAYIVNQLAMFVVYVFMVPNIGIKRLKD